MKKRISLIFVLLMLAVLFTGCGNGGNETSYKDNTDEEVTLVMAIGASEQKDTKEVVAEINKRLEKLLPNTKIELMLDDLSSKWPLWMATEKSIDIAHSGYNTDLEDEVRKGSYLALDELVAEHAPGIQKLQEKYWNAYDNATINGKLYAIPNVQLYAKTGYYLNVWNEAAKHMDLQSMKNEAWSSDKTTEKFWSLFSEGLDKAAAAGVDCSECINLSLYNLAKRGYVFIGGEDSNICYEKAGENTIIDFYTTDEFKNFSTYMKQWADKGYVSKDIMTGQWSDKTGASYGFSYGINEETGIKVKFATTDKVSLYMDNPELNILTTNIGDQATYWSIPFTAKNPARAMKFLNLLQTEEGAEIANLLAYGLEGKHYEVTDAEKGEIDAFEYDGQPNSSVSYGISNWMIANMLEGMYTIAPYKSDFNDWAIEYYGSLKDVKKHVLYGYSFDIDVVRNEFSQLIKNNAEYAESVYSGIVADSDGIMKTLQDKNKAAGQEKIMKELQKQADEYIESK